MRKIRHIYQIFPSHKPSITIIKNGYYLFVCITEKCLPFSPVIFLRNRFLEGKRGNDDGKPVYLFKVVQIQV